MSFKKTLLAAGLIAATTSANAAVIAGNGLQTGLNNVTQSGTFSQNVNNDQYTPDEVWTLDAVSKGNALMMFEFAGFSNTNTMGIYDLNSNTSLEIFSGAANTGWSTSLQLIGNNFKATYFDANGDFISQSSADFGGSDNFGFYLSTEQQNIFYSQSAKNGDWNNDGIDDDHVAAYRGTGADNMDPDQDGNYGVFTSNNFILAWEDLRLDGSDRDYADMVVMIESFIPVTEPATLGLLGLGLAGLGFARRKQAKA